MIEPIPFAGNVEIDDPLPAFEEFMVGNNYVLRFYRVDHGLICTINESMVAELREIFGNG